MKRQRGMDGGAALKVKPSSFEGNAVAATMTMANKKAKRKDENVKEIVGKEGLEEERRDDGNMGLVGAAENVMGYQENCYWPWLNNFVDEQMSWGSIWLPIWDMDLMGEAFAASFSDVAWDDDIWNLKNAKQFPNP